LKNKKKNNKNIWIIGISLAVAISIMATVIYVGDFEIKYFEPKQPEPQEIKEEVKPIEPPVIIKQPHPIIGEPHPTILTDEYLAKWKECLADETHGIQKIYPEICYNSDGLIARGPL